MFSGNMDRDRLIFPYAASGKANTIASVRLDELLAALKG